MRISSGIALDAGVLVLATGAVVRMRIVPWTAPGVCAVLVWSG